MKQSPEMQQLLHLLTEAKKNKYKGVPPELIPPIKLSDRTSKGLCKCIAEWLNVHGYASSTKGNVVYTSINSVNRQFIANVQQPGSGFTSFPAFYSYFSQLIK